MRHNDATTFARQYLDKLFDVARCLPVDELARAIELIERAAEADQYIFLTGNGGSAATALHMANDLMKGVAKGGGKGLRAIALSDNIALLTAIANDESDAEVFAGQLAVLAQPGDVLIVFPASGNSPNIVRAVEVARQLQSPRRGCGDPNR